MPGNGRARSRAKSAWPASANASISSMTFPRTIGSNRERNADGLNASRRAPRRRVWIGGSTPAMSPAGRNSWYVSSTSLPRPPRLVEYVSQSFDAAWTSSNRVSAQRSERSS